MKYTKQQLIQAMQKYNAHFLANPDDFDEIDNTQGCAESQVENLLSHVIKL